METLNEYKISISAVTTKFMYNYIKLYDPSQFINGELPVFFCSEYKYLNRVYYKILSYHDIETITDWMLTSYLQLNSITLIFNHLKYVNPNWNMTLEQVINNEQTDPFFKQALIKKALPTFKNLYQNLITIYTPPLFAQEFLIGFLVRSHIEPYFDPFEGEMINMPDYYYIKYLLDYSFFINASDEQIAEALENPDIIENPGYY